MEQTTGTDRFPKITVHVEADLVAMAIKFLDNRRKELPAIYEASASADFEFIARLAHNLKGAGASYGFPHLTNLGKSLEIASRERHIGQVQSLAQELEEYLSNVVVVKE